eukprot:207289-Amphidinium_carterae.1
MWVLSQDAFRKPSGLTVAFWPACPTISMEVWIRLSFFILASSLDSLLESSEPPAVVSVYSLPRYWSNCKQPFSALSALSYLASHTASGVPSHITYKLIALRTDKFANDQSKSSFLKLKLRMLRGGSDDVLLHVSLVPQHRLAACQQSDFRTVGVLSVALFLPIRFQ